MSEKTRANPLRDEAANQMSIRETILRAWLRDGIPWLTTDEGEVKRDAAGELVLAYFPTGIKELAEWTVATGKYNPLLASKKFLFADRSCSLSELTGLSRSTQNNKIHLAKRDSCLATIENLKERAEFQLAETNKTNRIAKLMEKLKRLEQINAAQEDEIRELRISVVQLNKKMNKAKRQYESNEEQLRKDHSALVEENMVLKKTLAKVTPLKSVNTEKE